MPIYEYRCQSCGEKFEKIQRQPLEEIPCPTCGKVAKKAVSLIAASTPTGGSCGVPGGSGFS